MLYTKALPYLRIINSLNQIHKTCFRYHLFLSDNIYGMFYNIADGTGSGEDHCELVGGTTSTAIVSADYKQSPGIKGNQNNVF